MNLLIIALAIVFSLFASQRKSLLLGRAGVALLAALLIGSAFLSDISLTVLINIFAIGIAAVGWNIIGGFTGYAAFGQVAFYGIGAYVFVLFAAPYKTVQPGLGWPAPLAFIMAIIIPALVALLIGLPVLRLKGHYFAIATLGVSIAVREVTNNVGCIQLGDTKLFCLGASDGLALPVVRANEEGGQQIALYFAALGMFAAGVVLTYFISRSKFGYGLFAIRENEEAAGVMGINATLYKNLAFMIAAGLAGLGGAIQAVVIRTVLPSQESVFKPETSLQVIIICLLGGIGTMWGPFVGTFIYFGIDELLQSQLLTGPFPALVDWRNVIFGLVVILLVLFLPKGILQLVRAKGGFTWRIFARNFRENSI